MNSRLVLMLTPTLVLSGCLDVFAGPPDFRETAYLQGQGGVFGAFRLDERDTVTYRISVENTTVDLCIIPISAEDAWKTRATSDGHACKSNVTEATGRTRLPAGEYAFTARTNGCKATCTIRFGVSAPIIRAETYRG